MLALWEYFWDWVSAAPVSSPAVLSPPTDAGGGGRKGDHPMDEMLNYDDLWAVREAYLRSLFDNPIKRQKALESESLNWQDAPKEIPRAAADILAVDAGWPEPVLKPRRKRT